MHFNKVLWLGENDLPAADANSAIQNKSTIHARHREKNLKKKKKEKRKEKKNIRGIKAGEEITVYQLICHTVPSSQHK